MIAEIETYQDQLLSIRQDADGLMSTLRDDAFNWRPAPNQWSMGECFEHLNLSAATVFVPAIDAAIARGKKLGLYSRGPFAYPALERIFLQFTEPPPKIRSKAPAAVKPTGVQTRAQVQAAFTAWQDRLADQLRQADGLDLRRARHTSPLRIWKWSLGTFFAIALAHERRHVWQAREIRKLAAFPG